MISVSRVYDCDSLLDGLRAPPLTGLPSPAARANGAMQTASSSELAMIQTRRDIRGSPSVGDCVFQPPTGHVAEGRGPPGLMSPGGRDGAHSSRRAIAS